MYAPVFQKVDTVQPVVGSSLYFMIFVLTTGFLFTQLNCGEEKFLVLKGPVDRSEIQDSTGLIAIDVFLDRRMTSAKTSNASLVFYFSSS